MLGSCGAYPAAGRACSGYLVQDKGVNLLLDIGAGCFSNLMKIIRPEEIDGVVVSHLHPDHYSDIHVFYNYMKYGIGSSKSTPLLAPVGRDVFDWPENFTVEIIDRKRYYSIGSLELTFLAVEHSDPAYAVKVEGSSTLVYSGDAKRTEELERFVRGSRLFLAEASFGAEAVPEGLNHMNAVDASTVAALGKADKLMITHIYPNFDGIEALAEAEKVFGPGVLIAREGMVEEVT